MNPRCWFRAEAIRLPPLYRFSLRTMLIVILLLSVALGWMGVQLKWIRDRNEARLWGVGKLLALYTMRVASSTAYSPYFQPSSPHNYRAAPWSLRIFGEPGVFSIDVPTSAADHELQVHRMQRLFPEASVGRRLELNLPGLPSTGSFGTVPLDPHTRA